MVVKFIVTRDGRIIFGDRFFQEDLHRQVAIRNGVREAEVISGGIADLNARKIWGKSYDFGPYRRDELMSLMPGWDIAVPGDY